MGSGSARSPVRASSLIYIRQVTDSGGACQPTPTHAGVRPLELGEDGSVRTANIFDAFPGLARINGSVVPGAESALLAVAPDSDAPDVVSRSVDVVVQYVSNDWSGLPVNFLETFLGPVACNA